MRFRRLAPYLLLMALAVALVWDASGRATRFTSRSSLEMASPILIWGFLLILLDRLLTYSGRSLFSPQLARALESIRWVFPVMATAYAFAPLWGPKPIFVGYGLMFAVPLIIEFVRVTTGKEGWLAGAYVNPADPRLVVPRRSGPGWSFNFARPAARVLVAVLLLLVGLAVVAVRVVLR